MAVKLLFNDIPAFFDSNGDPLNGGKLFTYAAGSSTKQNTYTTSAGTVAHANPIILNSRGEPANAIWGTVGISYKLVLSPSTDSDPPAASFWTIDNITPINDANTLLDQWLTGPSPTYINATQFTLVGDQTTTFHVGRRLKTTNTGGSIYSTITTTAYTTLTTVTVVNDSGSLDSGLSAVSYGLLTASDAAVPWAKIASTGWTFIKAVTMSDVVTMSGKSIIEANASIAAHATTMNPWSLGNYVTATGTAVTFTDLADAPQAGAEAEIYMNAAHIWTNNANLEVDGDANWTAEVGDRVLARAKAVTGPFTIRPIKKTGYAVITTVGNHSVVVPTGNGWGATNIMISRYTTVLSNVGTTITYADSAANGASFTINETGIYNLFMSDIRDAAVEIFGASVNSSQLSTYIENIDIANRVMMGEENVLARMGNCSITRRFSSGDVIRPHGDGNSGNTTNKVFFSVVKVGT